MSNIAIIGKNFGDEGKGLAVSSICKQAPNSLIIKHNGGAQAGHTVELKDGKRFIHHQTGSGAEYGSSTLLSQTFYPDLYQLAREVEEFRDIFGFIPKIYVEKSAFITTIDDVLLNMGAEEARKDARHGSCGMGINECYERNHCGYGITIEDIMTHDKEWISKKLFSNRRDYSLKRADELAIGKDNKYYELLNDEDMLEGFAEAIKDNLKYIEPVDASGAWLSSFDNLIFESGQGLLLDYDYLEFMPYLTPSKTGIHNPVRFLEKRGLKLDEAIFVTRTYVTRHGRGPLPNEVDKEEIAGLVTDMTNLPNEWQESIRYARHDSVENFLWPVLKEGGDGDFKISILLTHLDETRGLVYFKDEELEVEKLKSLMEGKIHRLYCSFDRFSTDMDDCN